MDFAVGAAAAALVSALACRLLIAAGLQDVPLLARKAHKAPTPTSGGLGIAMGVGAGLLVLSLFPFTEWREAAAAGDLRRLAVTTGAAYVFLLIGFVDDTFVLGPRGKLAVFVVASGAAVLAAGPVLALPVGAGTVIPIGIIIGFIGSMLWVFTLVNCVNFMDGANGLAIGSVAIGLLGLGSAALVASAPAAAALAYCGAAAMVGFLLWNFPGGRLFAGDSGALFAGAIAALASLFAIREGGVSPFVPPLLFFPMLADALLTLAWRAKRRRNLLDGHSDHIYQVGLRAGLSHFHVTLAYWAGALHCAAVGFVASAAWSGVQGDVLYGDSPARGFALAVSYVPMLALITMAMVAVMISFAARRFAKARGLDAAVVDPAPEAAPAAQ